MFDNLENFIIYGGALFIVLVAIFKVKVLFKNENSTDKQLFKLIGFTFVILFIFVRGSKLAFIETIYSESFEVKVIVKDKVEVRNLVSNGKFSRVVTTKELAIFGDAVDKNGPKGVNLQAKNKLIKETNVGDKLIVRSKTKKGYITKDIMSEEYIVQDVR